MFYVNGEIGIGKVGLFEGGVRIGIFNLLKFFLKIYCRFVLKLFFKRGLKIYL